MPGKSTIRAADYEAGVVYAFNLICGPVNYLHVGAGLLHMVGKPFTLNRYPGHWVHAPVLPGSVCRYPGLYDIILSISSAAPVQGMNPDGF